MNPPDTLHAPDPSGQAARTRWPHRLAHLVAEALAADDPSAAGRSREQAWILLYGVLAAYVRSRAGTIRSLGREDVRDVAAEKALDLMRQIDARSWDPSHAAPEQIRAYVIAAARNAVVDHAKSHRVELVPLDAGEGEGADAAAPAALAVAPTQEAVVDGRGYAAAILACLSNLTPKNRIVWYLRILLELTSQQIARHPSVRMRPGAVDVMLFRLRAAMRRCLAGRGVDPTSIPPGTFAWLWESIQGNDRIFPGEGSGR